MRITSSTSMNGIRLISGSSLARGRKFISGSTPAQGDQVAGEALGGQFECQQVVVDAAAEIAPEDQRRDGDDQFVIRVVERHRDAMGELRRVAAGDVAAA